MRFDSPLTLGPLALWDCRDPRAPSFAPKATGLPGESARPWKSLQQKEGSARQRNEGDSSLGELQLLWRFYSALPEATNYTSGEASFPPAPCALRAGKRSDPYLDHRDLPKLLQPVPHQLTLAAKSCVLLPGSDRFVDAAILPHSLRSPRTRAHDLLSPVPSFHTAVWLPVSPAFPPPAE